MDRPAHVLALPREIRDVIYKQYFQCADGYRVDFFSGKLCRVDGYPVDLALTLTCAQIASETRGLALRVNTIYFSSWYSDHLRLKMARIDFVLKRLTDLKRNVLFEYYRRDGISAEVIERVCNEYPAFNRALRSPPGRSFLASLGYFSNGQANSLERQLIAKTLGHLRRDSTFWASVQSDRNLAMTKTVRNRKFWEASVAPNDNHSAPLDLAPWTIPSDDVLTELVDLLSNGYNIREEVNFSFSAAAIAITYLTSLPSTTRLQLRKIILNENHTAVGNPECHAQGLIPFCQENPKLMVERRVDLWHNILVQGLPNGRQGLTDRSAIDTYAITASVSSWIVEALALESLGMPTGSFRFVLNGDPAPHGATLIMQVLHRDAAWQRAIEECFKRKIFPGSSGLDWHSYECYMFEGFPDALADMVHGRSIIQCNFELGEPSDVEELITAHADWPLSKWLREWGSQRPQQYECPPPLPPFSEIVRSYRYHGDQN
jgi:hypothetical protein